jgi:hypothetical protein
MTRPKHPPVRTLPDRPDLVQLKRQAVRRSQRPAAAQWSAVRPWLLGHDADPNARTTAGETPLDVGVERDASSVEAIRTATTA